MLCVEWLKRERDNRWTDGWMDGQTDRQTGKHDQIYYLSAKAGVTSFKILCPLVGLILSQMGSLTVK